MRNSILGSLQPRLEAVRRKESALRGAKKKGETGFTVESDLPTLRRTMKALSKERTRRTVVSLVMSRMTMMDLDARGRKEGERSHVERREGERSHRSRQHRDKSRREESWHSLHDAKIKDLKDKYSRILCQMEGEHPELTAWDMLEDESLPFTE
jgi:hypothetical protein